MIAENTFYVYGGMKAGQNTKLHICDDRADPLCGVNSFWMEAGERIDERGFIRGQEHFEPITEGTGVCKMCLKKWEARLRVEWTNEGIKYPKDGIISPDTWTEK